MFINIIKKDLQQKRVMNLILLIFIAACTVFLASSTSNLVVLINGLDHFAQTSNLPDYFFFSSNSAVADWLADQELVDKFELVEIIQLTNIPVLINEREYDVRDELKLSRVPQILNTPLSSDDLPLVTVEPGEVAIAVTEARRNNIQLGDLLHIDINGQQQTFEVTQFVKDILFGSELMGFSRLLISDDDFFEISARGHHTYFYSITTVDLDEFIRALNREAFSGIGTRNHTQDLIMNMYLLDLAMMAVLVVVGFCLIGISFVVLRFSILFTLQEAYQEIGILRAIGIRDKKIKRLYLTKYLFLTGLGVVIGFSLSFAFSQILMREIREVMALPVTNLAIYARLISAFLVIFLVVAFCYLNMRRLTKFTIMQVIGGHNQKRQKHSFFKLHKTRFMPNFVYLSLNDIFSNLKSYLVLVIIFILSFLLVVIPVNIKNTFTAEAVMALIGIYATDIYFEHEGFGISIAFNGTVTDLRSEIARMEAFYLANDLEISLFASIVIGGLIYTDSVDDGVFATNSQTLGTSADRYDFLRGVAPIRANEIAASEMTLSHLGLDIGDEVNILIRGQTHQFLITGSFQLLNNFGQGVRFADEFSLPDGAVFGIQSVQGKFSNRENLDEQVSEIRTLTTGYDILQLDEFSDMILGGILDTFSTMQQLILIVVISINVLIITLMSFSFMIKDLPQAALLLSLGFSKRSIKLWQGFRFLLVMMMALGVGVLLIPVVNLLAGIPFAMLGTARIAIYVDFIQIYLFYPAIFIAITCLVLAVTTLNVNKIGLSDLKNVN